MAYIASFLSKKRFKGLIDSVQLEFERGIHVRPQLIIKPSGTKYCNVCVIFKMLLLSLY